MLNPILVVLHCAALSKTANAPGPTIRDMETTNLPVSFVQAKQRLFHTLFSLGNRTELLSVSVDVDHYGSCPCGCLDAACLRSQNKEHAKVQAPYYHTCII